MKSLALAAIVALGFALSGCASIFEGTSQEIVVNTNPKGANCAFMRQGNVVARVNPTPGAATLKKNKYDITLVCNKPGYQEATFLNHSGVAGWTYGDIIGGGVYGGYCVGNRFCSWGRQQIR